MNKLIKDVYYNPTSSGYYAGVQQVYREAKTRNKKVTLRQVRDFLSTQDPYTLYKGVRRRFKRNITQSAGIDVHWQGDLADMNSLKRYNTGISYILVCIDVLSRFAFAEPVKRKTPQLIAAAFEAIVKRSKRKCWIFTTDMGMEFKGKPFQEMLQRHDIQPRYATSPDVKCAIVERYIRTLKTRIWRYFTQHKTLNYVKPLSSIVSAINNSYHRTIGCAPAKVTKANEKKIWEHLYGGEKPPVRAVFKPGDQVRITKEKGKLTKGYLPNFTAETFVVTKILKNRRPATYKLCDLTGETLSGIFYSPELVHVSKRRNAAVAEIVKSEVRRKVLWHQVKWINKKPPSWIKNTELM